MELEWERVNKQDIAALNAYLDRFKDSPHAQEARNLIARLLLEADRQAVLQSLANFVSAFNSKNLDEVMRIWPSGPRLPFRQPSTTGLR